MRLPLISTGVDLALQRPNLAHMQPRSCIATAFLPGMCLVGAVLMLAFSARAASLQTFAVVFGQVTNDIAIIESSFDNTPPQKQSLATLVRARSVILDGSRRDEQVLSELVELLGANDSYEATLNEAAANARAALLSQYDVMAMRVADLPPSRKTTVAVTRFNALGAEANALAQAQHAAGISTLLGPFGRRLASIETVVVRAQTMPKPRMGLNAVRARINGRRFASAGAGRPTPNEFVVSAPGNLYLEVSCRVVDGERVVMFRLPVLTDDLGYKVEQGLASFAFIEDIFQATPEVLATSGAFFVQRDRNEIYGTFSVAGPGLEVKDGGFRIQLPRELRGK